MKLELNMYVRTKWGYICKLININDFREPSMRYGIEANYLRDVMFIGDDDISKASHNIIDLIEVGDIVITPLGEIIQPYGGNIDELKDYWKITKNPIKSIVTKEQFESMSYKLGNDK